MVAYAGYTVLAPMKAADFRYTQNTLQYAIVLFSLLLMGSTCSSSISIVTVLGQQRNSQDQVFEIKS